MELPKTTTEFLVQGARFLWRLPFLYLSYSRNHPINVSPLSVDMNITDRCNFRCKMCRGINEDYTPKGEMDFNLIKGIIDAMKKSKVPYLTLGGGEPLLRYDIALETIDYATKSGIRVGVITNHSLLDEKKLLELVKAGLHRIAFFIRRLNQRRA